MKFGLILPYDQPRDYSSQQQLRDYLETVHLARQYGFDSVAVSHHFVSYPQRFFQPIPLLSRLAAETGPMQLITYVLQSVFYNPLDLADQIATLDIISGGHFVLGVAMGWREPLFEAFNMRLRERVGRFVESLAIMTQLWAGEEVSFKGRYFTVVKARLGVTPLQRPHPPIWIGAQSDPGTVRAGRLGHAWCPAASMPDDLLDKRWKLYDDALLAHGHAKPTDRPLRKDVYLASTREQAIKEAQDAVMPLWAKTGQVYASWGLPNTSTHSAGVNLPFEEAIKNKLLVCTPEECIDALESYRQRWGVNHVIFRCEWTTQPRKAQLRQIELLGERVLPHFRKKSE